MRIDYIADPYCMVASEDKGPIVPHPTNSSKGASGIWYPSEEHLRTERRAGCWQRYRFRKTGRREGAQCRPDMRKFYRAGYGRFSCYAWICASLWAESSLTTEDAVRVTWNEEISGCREERYMAVIYQDSAGCGKPVFAVQYMYGCCPGYL